MARLIVHLDEGPSVFVIDRDRTTIGREYGCDIRIPHKSVAPLHCEIKRAGVHYSIEQIDPDLFTLLNGSLVAHAALQDGDRIEIANFVIEFQGERDFSRDAPLFGPADASLEEEIPSPTTPDEGPPPPPAPHAGQAQRSGAEKPDGQPDDEQKVPAGRPHERPRAHEDAGRARQSATSESQESAGAQDEGKAEQAEKKALAGKVQGPSAIADEGSWYYTVGEEERGPATIEMLLRKIDEGEIDVQTLVRGPTNPVLAREAGEVRGLARFFNRCQGCGGYVDHFQDFCHLCGENLTHTFLERGKGPGRAKGSRGSGRFWKKGLFLVGVVTVIATVLATGLWRMAVGARTEEMIDSRLAGITNAVALVAGPEHFKRYRSMLKEARLRARAFEVAEAAKAYDRIESAVGGTPFAERARKEREDLLSRLYSEANEAAAGKDYESAMSKLELASQDPVFFGLYPQAKDKLARWEALAGQEE